MFNKKDPSFCGDFGRYMAELPKKSKGIVYDSTKLNVNDVSEYPIARN